MTVIDRIKFLFNNSLIKFGCVGVVNTAIDFSIFFTLHSAFGIGIITANLTAFSFAITNSYLMNKFWSFKHKKTSRPTYGNFLLFCTVSIIAVSLNTFILIIGKPYADLIYLKIIGAFITPTFNFLMYRYVVFRPRS